MNEETALFANEAFYAAFREGDYRAMAALWAVEARQCCMHPVWEPLFGREAIMASWKEVLRNPPQVESVNPYVILGHSMATVLCYEQVDRNFLAATNVYIMEGGRPRMVHHQAAATRGRPIVEKRTGPVLN